MTIGIPEQENPAIARVRQFAAAIRQGLAGQSPQPGVNPVLSPQQNMNRMAGQAAAPILQGGGSAPQTAPDAGGVVAQATPGLGFGQQIAALAQQRLHGRARFGRRGPGPGPNRDANRVAILSPAASGKVPMQSPGY